MGVDLRECARSASEGFCAATGAARARKRVSSGGARILAADDATQVLLLRESAGGLETVDGDEFKRVITALEKDDVE